MEGVETRQGLYGFDFLVPDKRRAESGERKTYEIQGLGYKNVEIAEILNIHPQTVSNTLNSELGERKLSEIRLDRDEEAKKVSEKIRVLTNKALDVYHEIFDDNSGESTLKDKKAVADTVALELSGLRAPTKIHNLNASYTLTKEELEAFKQRGTKAVEESGIVEAEVVENDS